MEVDPAASLAVPLPNAGGARYDGCSLERILRVLKVEEVSSSASPAWSTSSKGVASAAMALSLCLVAVAGYSVSDGMPNLSGRDGAGDPEQRFDGMIVPKSGPNDQLAELAGVEAAVEANLPKDRGGRDELGNPPDRQHPQSALSGPPSPMSARSRGTGIMAAIGSDAAPAPTPSVDRQAVASAAVPERPEQTLPAAQENAPVGEQVGEVRSAAPAAKTGREAVLLAGSLRNEDYPRSARRRGVQGSVTIRFVVGASGSPSRCAVLVSSGDLELDGTTCRLVEQRFRYAPAEDASGKADEQTVTKVFEWYLVPRRRR
jgi:protein TonB